MSSSIPNIPVPVLAHPHWRVNFRPDTYNAEAVPSLSDCFRIVESNRVSLRGWDYPHVTWETTQRAQGSNWVACWCQFRGEREYWRFYQSKQFLHLFSVQECMDESWRGTLESTMAARLRFMRALDWTKVPGFIHIVNFIYCVTEIFEFATRLCQAGIYDAVLHVTIELKGIKGFMLAPDLNHVWRNYCVAHEETLAHTWSFDSQALVSESQDRTLDAIIWFFERFGWEKAPRAVIREDMDNLLHRRI